MHVDDRGVYQSESIHVEDMGGISFSVNSCGGLSVGVNSCGGQGNISQC